MSTAASAQTPARVNGLGQPVGAALEGWSPPPCPSRETMPGRWCDLEPLDPERHARELHAANRLDTEGRLWTYLTCGPFDSFEAYLEWMTTCCASEDPLFFAIRARASGQPAGVASYLRVTPAGGSIEVGNLCFSPLLQRTPAATEAMYLMMRRAFELGYRRYEWKCDSLNAPSRQAAERLGFTFEGIFRQATVYKGRNRDTAWYSIVDREWPPIAAGFERWLDPGNFDQRGRQRRGLGEIRAAS